jgi:beta-lactamase class D
LDRWVLEEKKHFGWYVGWDRQENGAATMVHSNKLGVDDSFVWIGRS